MLRAEAAAAVARLAAEQARAAAAQAQIREVERLIEILRTREREGEGSRFDRVRAEQELRDTRQALTDAIVAAAEARADADRRCCRAGVAVRRVDRDAASQAPSIAVDTLIATATSRAPNCARCSSSPTVRRSKPTRRAARAARRRRCSAGSNAPTISRGPRDRRRVRHQCRRCRCSIRAAAKPRAGTPNARASRPSASSIESRIHSEISRRATKSWRCGRPPSPQEHAGAGDELAQIAEVAYREGDVGILELLDAVRVSARARDARHRPATRRPAGADRARTRRGRRLVALRLLAGVLVAAPSLPRLRPIGRRRLRPQPEEPEALSVTRWTDKTELFAEYPPLAAGATSRFAIHLTRLDTFKAITDGVVEVHLRGGAGQPEVFRVDGAVAARHLRRRREARHAPASASWSSCCIGAGINDEHRVGRSRCTPTPTPHAPPRPPAEEARRHQLPEGTAVEPGLRHRASSRSRRVRESIRVPGAYRGHDLAAPRTSSRRSTAADPRRGPGASAPASPADRSSRACCRRQRSPAICRSCSARAPRRRRALTLATRDRERAERLTTAGAAPEKRLDEARAVEEQAQGPARRGRGQPRAVQRRARRRRRGRRRAVRCSRAGRRRHRAARCRDRRERHRRRRAVPRRRCAQVHVVGQIPEADAARAAARERRRNRSRRARRIGCPPAAW